jgi:hypothetical protein
MADRLVARRALIGLTRLEVHNMLGIPASSRDNDRQWCYWLGPERGFISIDDEWLELHFGPDGCVVSSSVRPD